jgi:excisionase family DNA binding protein
MSTAAARSIAEQTIVPDPTERAVVIDLLSVLTAKGQQPPTATARLVSADGARQIDLPDDLHEALTHVVEALSRGYAVTIAPQHTTLTTQQAADMLGVSRPTLTKLLDEGKIPFDRPNSHRRIKLTDVLAYQQRKRTERRNLLRQMTEDSIDMGLYDTTTPHEDR